MSEIFDIQIVVDHFSTSLSGDDDVLIKEYLDGYEELNKFCNLMGLVFSFVSKDLRSKMDILYEFLKNEEVSGQFESVKKMMDYETTNNLLTKKDYTSGSRTLLRLHRGLDFIRVFLKSVKDLGETDNTSVVCRAAYDQTLSHHHTFVIRNGARLAMHTMPTREQLLKKMCADNQEEIKKTLEVLPRMLEITSNVFDRIDALYTLKDLQSLP